MFINIRRNAICLVVVEEYQGKICETANTFCQSEYIITRSS